MLENKNNSDILLWCSDVINKGTDWNTTNLLYYNNELSMLTNCLRIHIGSCILSLSHLVIIQNMFLISICFNCNSFLYLRLSSL